MSDISEINNPRCCSLISTESHLKDETIRRRRLTRSTRMLCVTQQQSCLNVTQLRRLFIVFLFFSQTGPVVKLCNTMQKKQKNSQTVESRNDVQQRSGASKKRFLIFKKEEQTSVISRSQVTRIYISVALTHIETHRK